MPSLVAKQVIEIEDRATRQLDRIAQATDHISTKMDNLQKNSQQAGERTQQSFKDMLTSGLKLASGLVAVHVSAKAIFGYLIERSKYLVSMQNILHATSAEMNALGKTMANVSKNSVVSMSEMYHGTFELSRRLRDVNVVSASVEHVKNIAGATKQGFTEASQIYGDLYLAFQKDIASGNTTLQDIADEVAYSFDKTKGNLNDYLQFIQNTTASLKANNVGLKEASAIYANLLRAGYGGSMAGTRYNTLMLELGNLQKRQVLAKALGVSFKELDIKERGFINVLETINAKTANLTETQRKAKLQSAVSPITESTLSFFLANTQAIKDYIQAQDKANFAQKANERVLNSTWGAWERLKNSVMSTGESFTRWDPILAGILNTIRTIWELVKDIMSLNWAFDDKNVGIKMLSGVADTFEEDYLQDLQANIKIKPKMIRPELKNNIIDMQQAIKENKMTIDSNNTNMSINKNQNEISLKVELDTKDKNLKAEAKDIRIKNANIANVKVEKRNFDNF